MTQDEETPEDVWKRSNPYTPINPNPLDEGEE